MKKIACNSVPAEDSSATKVCARPPALSVSNIRMICPLASTRFVSSSAFHPLSLCRHNRMAAVCCRSWTLCRSSLLSSPSSSVLFLLLLLCHENSIVNPVPRCLSSLYSISFSCILWTHPCAPVLLLLLLVVSSSFSSRLVCIRSCNVSEIFLPLLLCSPRCTKEEGESHVREDAARLAQKTEYSVAFPFSSPYSFPFIALKKEGGKEREAAEQRTENSDLLQFPLHAQFWGSDFILSFLVYLILIKRKACACACVSIWDLPSCVCAWIHFFKTARNLCPFLNTSHPSSPFFRLPLSLLVPSLPVPSVHTANIVASSVSSGGG